MPGVVSAVGWQRPLRLCAADRDPVAREPLLCMAAAALPAYAVLTHSGVLKFYLSSSLVFQVYPRRISDLSVCLSFFLPPSSLLVCLAIFIYSVFEMKSSCPTSLIAWGFHL